MIGKGVREEKGVGEKNCAKRRSVCILDLSREKNICCKTGIRKFIGVKKTPGDLTVG